MSITIAKTVKDRVCLPYSLLALAASGANVQDDALTNDETTGVAQPRVVYQKAFDCGPSAELQVDTGKRRRLKLVIKDLVHVVYE